MSGLHAAAPHGAPARAPVPSPSEVVLRLEQVRKRFGGLQVLEDIDLDVNAGERHALIGPNGAGKSTLFNLVSGRLSPSGGRIFFRGRDIAGAPPSRIARLGVGRSFQIINVFPGLTVAENLQGALQSHLGLRLALRCAPAVRRQMRERAMLLAQQVGLAARFSTPAAELSYGEQRRLEIALTLAQDPVLVLLDEPCAGLNADDTHAAIELIRDLTRGRTLLMVEHDMEVVFGLADRVSVLYYGKVLATGSTEEIRRNEQVRDAYLGRTAHAPGT